MKTKSELAKIDADVRWWEELSQHFGFGRLVGFTYRHSAGFDAGGPNGYINIKGALLRALMTKMAQDRSRQEAC
jgi:hypothetical protein